MLISWWVRKAKSRRQGFFDLCPSRGQRPLFRVWTGGQPFGIDELHVDHADEAEKVFRYGT